MLYIIQNSNIEEYESIILPSFRLLFNAPRSIQGSVVLLENLHIILEKTALEDITREVLPMLYNSFESNTIQIQVKFYVLVQASFEYFKRH
jgi:SCY1-like protein 2